MSKKATEKTNNNPTIIGSDGSQYWHKNGIEIK
jgi:hypothetical protein